LSFPVEFQQGMRHRSEILGDAGVNAPERWDEVWRGDRVHAWLGINGQTSEALEARCAAILAVLQQTGGASLLASQDASSIIIDGKPTTKEHFGYTDGFGNP
jgi:hypothetical protein